LGCELRASSFWLETNNRQFQIALRKLYSATLLLARLDTFSCSANCKIPRFARDDFLGKNVISFEEVLRTPAGTAALIKIYFALYLPNLFSCQSSSSLDFSSKSRLSGFGLFSTSRLSNPMFGVKTTFIGP